MSIPQKILITRTDRLGDTLVSLPSVARLRAALPQSSIGFLAREAFEPLLRGFVAEQRLDWIQYREAETDWSFLEKRFDAAVVLHDEPGLSRRLARARIPVRVGNRSKIRSWLWLTHGVRQRRSQAERTEAEYCLELVEQLITLVGKDATPASRMRPVELGVAPATLERGAAAVQRLRKKPSTRVVILHPGMGGSALNLSAASYAAIARTLETRFGCEVVFSQGPLANDRALVEAIRGELGDRPVLSGLGLDELSGAFRSADLVIAPSTGTLHLAHFSGATTLGIFSRVQTQSAERWRPFGGTGKSEVFSPSTVCPGHTRCTPESCGKNSCLDRAVLSGEMVPVLERILHS